MLGIRTNIGDTTMTFTRLQKEQAEWALKNFGDAPSHQPLLGVGEEVGELMHAHLKSEQKIRINQDHMADKKDAIGDIVIYLADYCTREGISLNKCVRDAWEQVKQRDWTQNKEDGIIE